MRGKEVAEEVVEETIVCIEFGVRVMRACGD